MREISDSQSHGQSQVAESIGDRYGNVREPALKFGSFDADIQPALGLGLLINPTEWLQNEEIQLQNTQSLARPDFTGQLRQQVSQSPYRGLLVVIHGFREAHESALRKTAFLGLVLDINAPVLLFDWPETRVLH